MEILILFVTLGKQSMYRPTQVSRNRVVVRIALVLVALIIKTDYMQGACQNPRKPIREVQGVQTNPTNLELLVLHNTMDSLDL